MVSSLRRLVARALAFFTGRRLDSDFQQELNSHVAMLADENVRRGMPPAEARRQALIRLGSMSSLAESHRDTRGLPVLDALRQDVSHALRMFRRAPWFFAGTVLTLALGIGTNGAVFGIVRAVLLEPLPYRDADRVVMVWRGRTQPGRHQHFGDLAMRAHTDANDAIESATYQSWLDVPLMRFDLALGDSAERVNGAVATTNFFDVLGVTALHGRLFAAADQDAGAPVVVLSHALWQRAFAADPGVIGRDVTMVGLSPRRPQKFVVIGVLPSGVHVTYPEETQVWTVLPWRSIRKPATYWNIGRLRDGQSLASAQARLAAIPAADLQPGQAPEKVETFKLEPMKEWVVGDTRPALILLAAVSGLLLLVACATVASAFFVRLADRQRELAMRAAIGAGRRRLGQQLLTEGVLLTLIGTGLGALAAVLTGPILRATMPASVPRGNEIGPSVWTIVFFAAAAGVVTIFAALGPAWSSARVDVVATLKRGGGAGSADRVTTRWRRGLVGLQSALSTALLLAAALLLVSFWKLTHVPTGFDSEGVLTVEMELYSPKYRLQPPPAKPGEVPKPVFPPKQSPAVGAFHQQVIARVRALPGVTDVGTASDLPFRELTYGTELSHEGAAGSGFAYTLQVDPGYLPALRVPVVRGRNLTSADTSGSPRVAMISSQLAKNLFGNQDPIGHIVQSGGPVEVVGVVGDVRYQGFERKVPEPVVYFPQAQAPNSRICLVVRLAPGAGNMEPRIREIVASLDPDLPIISMKPVEQIVAATVASRRFYTIATAALATLALVLTIVGLVVVVSRTVVERRREMAIRTALGATRRDLIASVMRQSLAPVAFGIFAGLGAVFASASLLQQFLFETGPRLPLLYGAVAVFIALIAVLASLIPARGAQTASPAVVMRTE